MRSQRDTTEFDARTVLERLSRGATLRELDDPTLGAPARVEHVLRDLLDLSATVRVADHLATARRGPPASADTPPSPLRARVAKKVGELRDEVRVTFHDPFHGRRAMPDAPLLLRHGRSTGAFTTRSPEAIAELAHALSAQARERFDYQLARFRQRLRWMRTDMTAEIRRQGKQAAEIEALDAVVARALEPGMARVQRRLESALDRVFAARLAEGIAAMAPRARAEGVDAPDAAAAEDAPATPDAAAAEDAPATTETPTTTDMLDTLVGPRGTLTRHASDLGALLSVLFESEVEALHALLDATSAPSALAAAEILA